MFSRTIGFAASFAVTVPALMCAHVAHAQQYNDSTPGYKQAVSAFKAASVIVLGRDLSAENVIIQKDLAGGYVSSAGQSEYFGIPMVTTNEMVQLFAQYDQQAETGDKIADGIKFTDAVKFLKIYLKQQSATSNKMIVMLLDKAFMETFGRTSTPTEQAAWTAKIRSQGLWYAPVKLTLIKQAQVDKTERTKLINAAYYYTLGRSASDAEVKYWSNRSEYYDQIVTANHGWLFSNSGATELPTVTGRALIAANRDTDANSIKKCLETFSAGQGMVYAEMCVYLAKNKQ